MQGKAGWGFAGRRDAGGVLARRVWARLWFDPARDNVLVLGASPGGLVVAAAVAAGTEADLDVVAACPIASPARFAHSVGAVTATGPAALARRSLDRTRLSASAFGSALVAARQRARARELAWRGYVPPSMIAGRTVVVVDDGLGVGVNALAVMRHVRRRRPALLLFAAPVCAKGFARALAALADEVIFVFSPPDMVMAGAFYARLTPVSDGNIRALLSARQRRSRRGFGINSVLDAGVAADVPIQLGHGEHSSQLKVRPRDAQPAAGRVSTALGRQQQAESA